MVKILLKLIANGNYAQDRFDKKFRSAMKGFIYRKLEESKFGLNKNNSNFRNFIFSNLFPISEMKIIENKIYNIILSSSNNDLIMLLLSKISIDEIINLGEGSFKIIEIKPFREDIKINSILISQSPVCVRTNDKDKFVNFEKNNEAQNLFVKNLGINLIKKYNCFYNQNIDLNFEIFKNVEINTFVSKNRKNSFVCVEIEDFDEKRPGKNIYFYGNMLKFNIGNVSDLQLKILQCGLDNGFGSLNSYGMGYVKVQEERKND